MYNLIISNQHLELTDALKNKIKNEFSKHYEKFGNFIHGNVNVIIKIENGNHIAECEFHAKKQPFFASHSSNDMYFSIDIAFKEVFRQVKKKKDILTRSKKQNKRLVIEDIAA